MATAAEKQAKQDSKDAAAQSVTVGKGRLGEVNAAGAFAGRRLRAAGDLSRYSVGGFLDDPNKLGAKPPPPTTKPIGPTKTGSLGVKKPSRVVAPPAGRTGGGTGGTGGGVAKALPKPPPRPAPPPPAPRLGQAKPPAKPRVSAPSSGGGNTNGQTSKGAGGAARKAGGTIVAPQSKSGLGGKGSGGGAKKPNGYKKPYKPPQKPPKHKKPTKQHPKTGGKGSGGKARKPGMPKPKPKAKGYGGHAAGHGPLA